MSHSTHTTPNAGAAPLAAEVITVLRRYVTAYGAQRLSLMMGGVGRSAIERAAAGGRVWRGTAALIVEGLQRLEVGDDAKSAGGD